MTSAKNIIIYEQANGKKPYTQWLNSLRDPATRRRIIRRLLKLQHGHYGDFKAVGDGVLEMRFFFGSGYRVYFAEEGDTIVVLLCGGDKDSQPRDIELAKQYWQEYQTNA